MTHRTQVSLVANIFCDAISELVADKFRAKILQFQAYMLKYVDKRIVEMRNVRKRP